MNPIKLGRLLGLGALGALLLVGCRNTNRNNCCCCPCPCECYEIQQPTLRPSPVGVLPGYEQKVEQVAAKKDERPNVAYIAVAPGMSPDAAVSGTLEMTASDADKVGIRPGYTPGSLYVPARPQEMPPAPIVQNPDLLKQPEGSN